VDRFSETLCGRYGPVEVAQRIHRGHYELGVDARSALRVAAAFTELARAI
jgi:hypothetical protein